MMSLESTNPMKKVLDFFRTLGRIRQMERPIAVVTEDRRSRSRSRSGVQQIFLEQQLTEELLQHIESSNQKAKSFQYRLEIEDIPQVVV